MQAQKKTEEKNQKTAPLYSLFHLVTYNNTYTNHMQMAWYLWP